MWVSEIMISLLSMSLQSGGFLEASCQAKPIPRDGHNPVSSMRIRENVYWNEYEGQIIIVEMDSGKYFALDSAGANVWMALAGRTDPQNLKFDTQDGPNIVSVSTVVDTLLARGLIQSGECESSGQTIKGHNLFANFIYRIAARRPRQILGKPSRWKKVRLFAEAYILLILVDIGLLCLGFHGLFAQFSRVSSSSSTSTRPHDAKNTEWLCDISLAAFRWYRPNVACVHRALNAYLFLRRHGVPVELCLGVEPRPFESHAWVECEGRVLGDSQDFCNSFLVMARVS